MFKHILLPTDGSELSQAAALRCIQYAHDSGARITALHVMPEFHVIAFEPVMLEDSAADFRRHMESMADEYLMFVLSKAKEEGVICDTVKMTSDHPWKAIVQASGERGCDLIFMASHGRKGITGLLLGSETQKVLTHSRLPVLVHR